MSDKPAQNIPIKPLVRKDEKGQVIASITPQLKVIGRGEAEGNVYPTIVVTKENFNEYAKLRGLDDVLDIINANERLKAQACLESVLDPEYDWEEVEGATDKQGKPAKRFNYIIEKFVSVIDKFYETLLSGKVRGGVTITDLEAEQEEIDTELRQRNLDFFKTPPQEQRAFMEYSMALSKKWQDIQVQIDEIRKNRKPRKTKAEKLAEQAAKLAAQQKPTA